MNLQTQLESRRRMLVTANGQLAATRRAPLLDRNLVARLETLIAEHRRAIADLERAFAREKAR